MGEKNAQQKIQIITGDQQRTRLAEFSGEYKLDAALVKELI